VSPTPHPPPRAYNKYCLAPYAVCIVLTTSAPSPPPPVHFYSHAGPGSAEIRAKNEDGLMRLNGFLDLAEARSTHTTGRAASCDAAYTFEFLTLKQAPAAKDERTLPPAGSAMHTVAVTVNIPATLVPATTQSSLKREWTTLTAQCAVDLLEKASMDVPQELFKAAGPTSLPRFQTSITADANGNGNNVGDVGVDGSWRQRQRHGNVKSSAATTLSRDEVVKMTLKNIREHEDFELVEQEGAAGSGFRPVSGSDMPGQRSKRQRRAQRQGRGGGGAGHGSSFPRRKDKEAVVWQIFNSKRVSVSPGMEDRPEDVMRGATELQAFLLAHGDDLALHDARWTSTIIMLTPPGEVDAENAARAAEDGPRHVVHVPCPLALPGGGAAGGVAAGESVLHDRRRLVQELRRAVLGSEDA
jgi:hypothetical protein